MNILFVLIIVHVFSVTCQLYVWTQTVSSWMAWSTGALFDALVGLMQLHMRCPTHSENWEREEKGDKNALVYLCVPEWNEFLI